MMSIRKKTISAITLCLFVTIALLFAFSKIVLQSGFEEVERQEAIKNISRVKDALAMQVENLEVKIIDWSIWDDAYKYIQDGNEEFEKSSLAEGSLLGAKFDLFVWVLPNKDLRWGKEFDQKNQTSKKISHFLEKFFKETDLFNYKDEKDIKSGIVVIPTLGPIFFSSQPIVTSEGVGPIAGGLFAGRLINENMIETIKNLTHINLKIIPIEEWNQNKETQSVLELESDDDQLFAISDRLMKGIAKIEDFYGKKIGVLEISLPREIFLQGQSTILSLIIGIVFCGLFLAFIISLILDQSVIKRILSLSKDLQDIETKEDLSRRISEEGKDEITSLCISANRFISSIEKSKIIINSKNKNMRLILDHTKQGFVSCHLDGSMESECSKILIDWFDVYHDQKKIWDYIFPNDEKLKNQFKISWDQLSEDYLPFLFNAKQMIQTFKRKNILYSIEYKDIRDQENKLIMILVVISDITEKLENQKKEIQKNELLSFFKSLSEDRYGFYDFFSDTEDLIKDLKNTPLEETKNRQIRIIHTIKGNCTQYGFLSVSNICHSLESKLQDRKDPLSLEDLDKIYHSWHESQEKLYFIIGEKESKKIEIHISEYEKILKKIISGSDISELKNDFLSLRLEPIEKKFKRIDYQINALSERMGKGKVHVIIEHQDIRLKEDYIPNFWKSITHVIRNTVDHGFSNDLQIYKQLILRSYIIENHLYISIKDNGCGIDWIKIKKKAIQLGLKVSHQKDLESAIFYDGLSTKDSITSLSGRGIGLSAVAASVMLYNGTIEIKSHQNQGTEFIFSFPC